jgi:hypothetical protein
MLGYSPVEGIQGATHLASDKAAALSCLASSLAPVDAIGSRPQSQSGCRSNLVDLQLNGMLRSRFMGVKVPIPLSASMSERSW